MHTIRSTLLIMVLGMVIVTAVSNVWNSHVACAHDVHLTSSIRIGLLARICTNTCIRQQHGSSNYPTGCRAGHREVRCMYCHQRQPISFHLLQSPTQQMSYLYRTSIFRKSFAIHR
ncbi:hypothetical protein GGR57DRAFT_460493 [Xylariaceae sp. FL1272]|nr:hypothetical protein GGR57DRAFT_460493 [Xylariaceae sp. FL1272]